jgi:DNA-binding response OmpR family regulator
VDSTNAPSDKRVLVVEDDGDVRALLVRALSTRYTVVQAEDGLAALEVLKKTGAVDLIICDVMMPKMNGYALSRLLKADAKMKTIPIVFLTARTSAKDVVAGINAGARHYIGKPFSVKDVLDKVGKLLK